MSQWAVCVSVAHKPRRQVNQLKGSQAELTENVSAVSRRKLLSAIL